MSNSSSTAPVFTAFAPVPARDQNTPVANDPIARFHAEYPSLAGELPHRNARNGATLHALEVTCDDCATRLPLEALRGVINDYTHCTEVRYAGVCPRCERMVHNVLRLSADEMRFIHEGQWRVATRRPWWHCLWPWPIEREW